MAFDSPIKLSWSDQKGAAETKADQKLEIWGITNEFNYLYSP